MHRIASLRAFAMIIAFGAHAHVLCFTDINDSGVTDVDDLLVVINGWGACETPPCASDVDLSGSTNVDDLLHVINRWGDCP